MGGTFTRGSRAPTLIGAGGHYYDGLGSDPWCSDCVKWHSDAKGVAVVSLTMKDFTLDPAALGTWAGGRWWCTRRADEGKAAIEPLAGAEVVTLGRHPGFAGADTVRGMMLEKQVGCRRCTSRACSPGSSRA